MTDEYPKSAPFKDSAGSNNLVDLPEVSTGRRRNDSLIPGVQDKYLMIGGIAVSSIIGLVALSQTPAVQNLIKRVTNRAAPVNNEEEEAEPIQVPDQQHLPQGRQAKGFRVVNQDPRVQQQQAEATAIAQQIALQEQQRQLALQQQADTPGQVDASMYDRVVGGKDSNSIKAYRIDNRRRNYSSPFGASFSAS